jgi:dUTP pyrophosphatase
MYCADGEDILPGDTSLVGLGVKCRMVDTTKPSVTVGYYMYPRSSIYKTPLRLVNSVGIIDKDYRGELKAPLQNNPNVSTYLVDFTAGVDVVKKYTYSIEIYSRLVQICAPDLSPLSVAFVDELDNTSRGSGGFGSTGI